MKNIIFLLAILLNGFFCNYSFASIIASDVTFISFGPDVDQERLEEHSYPQSYSNNFNLENNYYNNVYFSFIAAGDYGRDYEEEGIKFSLNGFNIGDFCTGGYGGIEYTVSIPPAVGYLDSFSYTEEDPGYHFTLYGTINISDDFFNSLVNDYQITVGWLEASDTHHLPWDSFDEYVMWKIDAVPAAPVPEPSTFLLLGSGLAGLFFYRLLLSHASV